MNNKKDVHVALQESFKKLILKHNFDKITIKMITDDAGLIRPTFYNHYADKYEVLEEIFYNDIFKGSKMLIENKMPYEAIYYMFSRIESNKKFYLQAIKITGQNSFEEIINNNLIRTFDNNGKEILLMGCGLGFQKKIRDTIDRSKIEKIYAIENKNDSNKLMNLLSEIPLEYIQVSNEIISYAKY